MKVKAYSVAYRRCAGGMLAVQTIKAVSFQAAVAAIEACSADSGPEIVHIIELPGDREDNDRCPDCGKWKTITPNCHCHLARGDN